jgi:hypothetical protein
MQHKDWWRNSTSFYILNINKLPIHPGTDPFGLKFPSRTDLLWVATPYGVCPPQNVASLEKFQTKQAWSPYDQLRWLTTQVGPFLHCKIDQKGWIARKPSHEDRKRIINTLRTEMRWLTTQVGPFHQFIRVFCRTSVYPFSF